MQEAHGVNVTIIFLTALLIGVWTSDVYEVQIDTVRAVAKLDQFWKSTGYCPPDPHNESYRYDYGHDMIQNVMLIGGLPYSGMKQVRIHWLLDLVHISHFEGGQPVYNFAKLDKVVQLLWVNDLRPGFELMGNPSNFFSDFESKMQLIEWRRLVRLTAKRYIERYGVAYVMEWNFETWNEPDHHDFDGLNITIQGFLNYYDACSMGLQDASSTLKFGGPGASCRLTPFSKICWTLLDHVTNGLNYFTGQRGVRIDFISFHKKGGHNEGSADQILQTELETISHIRKLYPSMADKPIFNDEADPVVGWSKSKWWRADVTYAAIATKVIAQHQNKILALPNNTIQYRLLSNDNGFLSYNPHFFDQRTLLARFQINNTRPFYTHFIKKPIYTVMGMLAALGETQLRTTITKIGPSSLDTGNVGLLASAHETNNRTSSLAVVLYNSVDTSNATGQALLSVSFKNLPANLQTFVLVTYQLDNGYTNPSAVWRDMGRPVFPNVEQLQRMRAAENPCRTNLRHIRTGTDFVFKINLPLPSVQLILLCSESTSRPNQVSDVQVLNITLNQLLIVWSDKRVHARCIKTYEVEYSKNGDAESYKRINKEHSFYPSFIFTPETEPNVLGYYRIRAVDVWNRRGHYSIPVLYNKSGIS